MHTLHGLNLRLALAAASFCIAAPLFAQAAPPKPVTKPADAGMHGMDHSAMEQEHGGSSGWKELDAYHEFMMATWHPAKGKNDLAPLRTKAGDMAASAQLLAASTPPKWCDTPKMKGAATALAPATANVAALVTKNATDAELKTALGALHMQFETLEEGCTKPAPKKG